jgi:hypothetical protein
VVNASSRILQNILIGRDAFCFLRRHVMLRLATSTHTSSKPTASRPPHAPPSPVSPATRANPVLDTPRGVDGPRDATTLGRRVCTSALFRSQSGHTGAVRFTSRGPTRPLATPRRPCPRTRCTLIQWCGNRYWRWARCAPVQPPRHPRLPILFVTNFNVCKNGTPGVCRVDNAVLV